MIQKLSFSRSSILFALLFASLAAVLLLGFSGVVEADTPQETACGTIEKLTGADCEGSDTAEGEEKVGDIAVPIVNILSAIAGAVAVIFLVIGGIKYATSGGSPDKIKSAKGTILAALIGFALIIATQFILNIAIGFTEEVTSDVAPTTDGDGGGDTGTTGSEDG